MDMVSWLVNEIQRTDPIIRYFRKSYLSTALSQLRHRLDNLTMAEEIEE